MDLAALLIKSTFVLTGAYLIIYAQKFTSPVAYASNDDKVLAKLKSEISGRDHLLSESKKQYVELSNINKELQSANKEAEQKLGILQENLQQVSYSHEEERKKSQAELDALEKKIQSNQEELENFRSGSQIKQIRNQFEEKKQELIDLRKKLFDAEGEIESLQRRIQDQKELLEAKDFQNAKDLYSKLSEELESITQERKLLQDIIVRVKIATSNDSQRDESRKALLT